MRRSALLLAAPVLAAGLLAGCDLPGGSPRVLGPDQVPNNSAEEAPTIALPAIFNGSLDPNDQADFFRLERPRVTSDVRVVCTGDVEVGLGNVASAEQSAQDIFVCDGQPHFLGAGGGDVAAGRFNAGCATTHRTLHCPRRAPGTAGS